MSRPQTQDGGSRGGAGGGRGRSWVWWLVEGAVLVALVVVALLLVGRRGRESTPWDGPPLLPGERTERGDLEQRRAFEVPADGFNVLFIVIDSLRHDHLGCYGYDKPTSPAIDRFAEQSVLFEDHISQCSWTLPSHATMFLGQNPSAHGVDHNFERISPSAVTLPLLLQRAGYRTVGFACAPLLETPYGIQRGFDVYDDTLSSEATSKSWRTITSEQVLKKALAELQGMGEQRLFMFLHMWDVHYDYRPPPPFDTMFDPTYSGDLDTYHWVYNDDVREYISARDKQYIISLYDGEIAWVDFHLGFFFERLDQWGVLDDTVVIITSDHGEEFFEHGLTCHNHSNFEELVHVPFIMRIPGIDGPVRIPCRTAMVDLFPTVLDLTGATPSEKQTLQGQSLLPLIRDDEVACDPQREILTETVWSKHHVPLDTKKGYEIGMYRGPHKVSRRLADPQSDWLFDLAEDPGEQENLAEDRPELFEEMQQVMKRNAEDNAEIHGHVGQSRHKKLDRSTRDVLEALGYVD